MLHRACPLCLTDRPAPFLSAGDVWFGHPGTFTIVRCGACTALYTSPAVPPEEIGRYYPSDYAAHAADRPDAAQRRGSLRRRGRDPWDDLPRIGRMRLLDFGCGSGAYLLRRREAGWSVTGVEPSHDAVVAARSRGLEVIEGSVPGVDLSDRTFDVITLLGVVACLPDPLTTLRALRERLADEGMIIVSTDNADAAAANWFGPDWPGWDLPRHYVHFTEATLTDTLHRAGFAHVRIVGKRRTSRWRAAARARYASTGKRRWRFMARHRDLCSVMSRVLSRGRRADEIVAIAHAR